MRCYKFDLTSYGEFYPDVMPYESIEEINTQQLQEFGAIDFCGDWHEIYVN